MLQTSSASPARQSWHTQLSVAEQNTEVEKRKAAKQNQRTEHDIVCQKLIIGGIRDQNNSHYGMPKYKFQRFGERLREIEESKRSRRTAVMLRAESTEQERLNAELDKLEDCTRALRRAERLENSIQFAD